MHLFDHVYVLYKINCKKLCLTLYWPKKEVFFLLECNKIKEILEPLISNNSDSQTLFRIKS